MPSNDTDAAVPDEQSLRLLNRGRERLRPQGGLRIAARGATLSPAVANVPDSGPPLIVGCFERGVVSLSALRRSDLAGIWPDTA